MGAADTVSRRVRALSIPEQAMAVLNQRVQAFSIVTISRVRLPLSAGVIQTALDRLQQRHPYLRCRLVNERDRWYFEGYVRSHCPQLPVRVIENVTGEPFSPSDSQVDGQSGCPSGRPSDWQPSWQSVVEDELNRGFEAGAPLMRTTLIPGADTTSASILIVVLHHAIADGISSLALHAELLRDCKRAIKGERVKPLPALTVLPPLEVLLPRTRTGLIGKQKSKWFLLKAQGQLSWRQPEALPFESQIPIEQRRCGLVHITLNPSLTKRIIQTAKQAQTTVQGALCAAMLLAVAQVLDPDRRRAVSVNCQSYVDLRQRLSPPIGGEDLGMLASALLSFHRLNAETTFWDLARGVKQQIETGLKRQEMFDVAAQFSTIVNAYLDAPKSAPATVGLTNLGRLAISEDVTEVIEEISFAVGQRAYGGILAAAVSTFRDRMTLNFLFSQPSLSRETVRELADRVVLCLQAAAPAQDAIESRAVAAI